ncbi:hypothetical protein [Natronoflexus pectinivorans]|uniref:Uncharacterized protein n=1 Tax=Natronoflexus pectinivorans TaxID=682526 RepID=A0A4R2GJ51_9BACT|nr:hypothetical protein [Natronoflexus pectinivorans]TCO08342.1 hypothetical protein EV194_105146 [Natronoflexus pectinivorans]
MNTLDNIDLIFLDDNQSEQVNGGIKGLALAVGLSLAYDIVSDWSANVAAFKAGWNS